MTHSAVWECFSTRAAAIFCTPTALRPQLLWRYVVCRVGVVCRNKHIMVDLGTGNNNKINWAMNNKQVSRHI